MLAEYIDHCGTDLSSVNAARVSMGKESKWDFTRAVNTLTAEDKMNYVVVPKMLSEKDEKLIHYLAKKKHDSCFEHQTVTLRLKVPLFIARQIHRHRTFAYNEISRRYVKDDLEFYWPATWRKAAENVKQGSSDEPHPMVTEYGTNGKDGVTDLLAVVEEVHGYIITAYHDLIEQGVCTEQARMILPQNLYTQFYMTGNLRNWVHFLKLRIDAHAQKEVRDIAEQCAVLIKPLFPVSYQALMNA